MKYFHLNAKATIQYGGNVFDSFEIKIRVKNGCVLATTVFRIFFSMLLKCVFGCSSLGVKRHTRTDGNLLNLARLRAKRKVKKNFTVRDLLFVDVAALVVHSAQDHTLLGHFSSACSDFGITISLKKLKS